MKKIYKFLLTAATALLGLSATAQVTLYSFSQLSGTYSAITGGTVFGGTSNDDETYVNPSSPSTSGPSGVGIPIGFNFTFNFNVFDRIGVNNNGWIGFGNSAFTPNAVNITNTGSNYNGISAAATTSAVLQHRVAGLSRDIQGNGTNSSLRVQTIGTTPNQVCVIQFADYKRYGTTGTGDDFSFQIRLYETTNRIEVVYGGFTVNATPDVAEVGIRGNSNADYSNRIVNSTNPWNASIPGTVNTSQVNYNNTGLTPASGQIYRWDPPPPCAGAPPANTILSAFSIVCPGGANSFSLANTYTTTGNTYLWYVSTVSAVGPFTAVPTATGSAYTPTGITASGWYQVVVTCTNNPPASTTITPYNLLIAGTTTNNVPYLESFEGITVNNQLPNCSWSATNPTVVTQTYIGVNANNRIPHTGSKFAAFKSGTAAAGDYFYTNGIYMQPGITYSAALWYITDGAVGWQELSILYGTTQSTTGLSSIVTSTSIGGQFYQSLSNTFTVPSAGLYYVAVKCRANSTPTYLSWDDLSITIPCSLNSPTVTVVTTPSIACEGQEVTMAATGADSYLWSTGDITSSITFSAFTSMNYSVVGTSSLSSCSSTVNPLLIVNNSPHISVFPSSSIVCAGSTATLNAVGALTYTWSNNAMTSAITVTPASPGASYTVMGSNANGCVGMASQQLTVRNLPNVNAQSTAVNDLCVGETATLSAFGALTYQWQSNSVIITTQQAFVSPVVTTIYTLTGTDSFGCSNVTTMPVNVSACLGIKQIASELSGVKLYPNPGSSDFTIELNNGSEKMVQVTDVTGRMIINLNSSNDKINVNTNGLASGIYYVKISSGSAAQTIKFIKN